HANSPRKDLPFFHIPRCGGTSIESAFELQTSKHFYGIINRGDMVLSSNILRPLI
ncbi:MAG: hypothetical protein ACI9FR_002429, partial [Cryomorphaceae bacterium]